jgi:hypothetical protein
LPAKLSLATKPGAEHGPANFDRTNIVLSHAHQVVFNVGRGRKRLLQLLMPYEIQATARGMEAKQIDSRQTEAGRQADDEVAPRPLWVEHRSIFFQLLSALPPEAANRRDVRSV